MANHGYITSRRFFKKEEVYKILCEINQNRFSNLLSIKENGNSSWFISYLDEGNENPIGFSLWISSNRKLEHRHSFHSWVQYLEAVFANEIGSRYNGNISDECCNEKWKPDPSKYSSYKEWIDIHFNYIKDNIKTYNTLVQLYMQSCPKQFVDM